MSRTHRFISAVCTAGLVVSCDAPAPVEIPGSLELTLASTEAALTQGSAVSVGITISRANFDGPVTLSTNALPAGLEVTFQPGVIASGATTSTATVSVSSFVSPTAFGITLVAKGAGAEATATFAITVGVKGSYSLGLLNQSVTVAQGGAGSTTVLVSRENSFPGVVSFSVTDAPAGVTASFDTSRTDRNFAELLLTAAPTTATGTQQITVTGKTTGLPDQTTTLTVDIIAPPATSNVTITYCSGRAPAWVAYRNEGYGWQRATVVGDSVTIPATARLGFARVYATSGVWTYVDYLTRAELLAYKAGFWCSGSKTLSGVVAGLSSGERATVRMGGASATALPSAPNFTLQQVQSGPVDLLAIRRSFTYPYAADKVIIRRALDFSDGGAIPTLDFASEGFAPATSTLSITGLNADDSTTPVYLGLLAGTSFLTLQSGSSAPSVSLLSVPPAQMSGSDIHELYVEGTRVIGGVPGAVVARVHLAYYTTTGDRTVALPPDLRVPTFSVIGAAPYLRARALLPSQPEYPTLANFQFYGGSRGVVMTVTSAYLGATPTTWDVSIPHFGNTAGFNNGWGLEYVSEYYAYAVSGPSSWWYGVWPSHGDVVNLGWRWDYVTLRSNLTASPGDGQAGAPLLRRERIPLRRDVGGIGRTR